MQVYELTAEGRTMYMLESCYLKRQVPNSSLEKPLLGFGPLKCQPLQAPAVLSVSLGPLHIDHPGSSFLEREDGIKQKEDWVEYTQSNSGVFKLDV